MIHVTGEYLESLFIKFGRKRVGFYILYGRYYYYERFVSII